MGIEYDLEGKPFYEEAIKFFPPGFTPGSEHLYLKKFIEEFEGNDIVLTVPPMPYRCPPAPYERAAMLLSYIRAEGLNAHLYFIDANPHPPILKEGFMEAYRDFYRKEADYITSADIKDIDVASKTIKTDKGDIKFDFASIIPPMRAPKLLQEIGLLGKGEKWVSVNPLTFESKIPNVFVIGDSASTYLPKSGYAAHSEAKVVAKVISGRIANRRIMGRIIQHGICYAMVNLKAAMMLEIEFIYDANLKRVKPIVREDNTWKVSTAKRYYEWAKGVWRDMFN
jgi:NADPH-dependent 2,4-dienoyl-CoA reductase/sulfur reductase-like enzyme